MPPRKSNRKSKLAPDLLTSLEKSSISPVLHRAQDKYPETTEESNQARKKNFSEEFSRSLAQYLSDLLRPEFDSIQPNARGSGHESRMSGARGLKKTDVRYSTPEIGMGFVISIKTTHFRDRKTKDGKTSLGDFNHNETRFDSELRAEAAEIHERSPFGVLIGLFVLPEASANLYMKNQPSSFAKWVRRFRPRAGRRRAEDRNELFERIFIGLYDPDGRIVTAHP
jgi:hypothetical protein